MFALFHAVRVTEPQPSGSGLAQTRPLFPPSPWQSTVFHGVRTVNSRCFTVFLPRSHGVFTVFLRCAHGENAAFHARRARAGLPRSQLTSTPVATTTVAPITLYHRNPMLVNSRAAKIAASPASTPQNAPVPSTRLKKNASVNTPSKPPHKSD